MVEGVGDLRVGVGVEELVEAGEGVGVGLAGLPAGGWDGTGDAGGLAAFEADVEVDDVGSVDGDVFDEEADHALAFPLRGGGIAPQGRKVVCQRPDLCLLLVSDGRGGLGGAIAVVLGVAKLA